MQNVSIYTQTQNVFFCGGEVSVFEQVYQWSFIYFFSPNIFMVNKYI